MTSLFLVVLVVRELFFHQKKIFGCFGQFLANMESLPFKIGLPTEEVLPIWRIGNS